MSPCKKYQLLLSELYLKKVVKFGMNLVCMLLLISKLRLANFNCMHLYEQLPLWLLLKKVSFPSLNYLSTLPTVTNPLKPMFLYWL